MDSTEPHFFGSSERQLFGVYHEPSGRPRAHGVLICPPAPQEYMRSHMALRTLAALLAREGFPVLRFDYYATGDSAGESSDGNLFEWRANIVAARDDLRECSGAKRISVVGLRLGATLAASVPLDAVNLVMWEPVVDGKAYVNELRSLHRRQFARCLFPPPLPERGSGGVILGFPLSAAMEAELRAIDLVSQPPAHAQHVAVVISEERPEYLKLRQQFQRSGALSTEFCHVAAEPNLDQQDAMLLISSGVLQAMSTVLTRRAA
jgi:uncharacterized protein